MAETLPEGPGIYVVGGRRYQLPGPPDAGTVAKLEAHAQQQAQQAPPQPQQPGMLQQAASVIPFAMPIMEQLSKHPDVASGVTQAMAIPALMAARMAPEGKLARAAVSAIPALASFGASNYLNRKPGEGIAAATPTLGQVGQIAAGEGTGALAEKAMSSIVRPGAEALMSSRLAKRMLNRFGTPNETLSPIRRAGNIVSGLKDFLTTTDDATRNTLTHSLETYGGRLHELDDEGFMALLRTKPEKIEAAASAASNAGHTLVTPEDLQHLWVDDAVLGSAKTVRDGYVKTRALYNDAGERKILNGPFIAEQWRGLSDAGRKAFGKATKGMDAFVTNVEKLKKAPIGIQRIVGAEKGQIPMDPFYAVYEKIAKAYGKSPMKTLGKLALKGAGIGTAGMEALSHPKLVGGAMALVGLKKGAEKLGNRAAYAITQKMLTTEGGMKMLSDGVRMMAEGHPRIVIANALSRTVGPDLLAAWGFESPQQAPGQ